MTAHQPPAFRCLQVAAVGPWLSIDVRFAAARSWQRRGRAGCAAPRKRPPLRCGCPAMLGLVARRRTRCVRFALYARTTSTSQSTKRAARAATSPALLGASQARRSLPTHTFARSAVICACPRTTGASRQAVFDGGDLWGDEERRAPVGARSALRRLTRRSCLNEESEANVVSSSTRPETEHRSAVAAKRRPPQYEPPANAACREEQTTPMQSGPSRRTALGRKQSCATRTKFKLTSSPDAALQKALAFHVSRVAQRAMEN